MPLDKIEQINPSRLVGIWHISENLDQLLQLISLTEAQLAEMNLYKVDNKKLEWLSARILIKLMAAQFDSQFEGLIKDEHGKPSLRNSTYQISLSHSYPYVAAIIDKTKDVGIDIEQPKEKLQRVAHRFLSKTELEFIKDDTTMLCKAWCGKETLYKIYGQRGLIFSKNLLLEPYDHANSGTITGNIIVNGSTKKHKLEYKVTEDYVLTYNVS
ncbi:4'-phosphopantetheinyl transferase family protein [Fulvivirga lutimaris]|uniref:4'-phosphopantetheinyl transferase family protein n=1 Tax=Fulvivirga lutimaris TaxID=1819566 RepID=UPI0012BB8617|nr:4'-phosphopantetheinyl transferase superfamily protein [Fulvivirga lutimaris]MTI39153.1 4'-phosphopantetheinyl transferase superfamily protein [Fulvivirga lutimaris]